MRPKYTAQQGKLQILYLLDKFSSELEKDQIWRSISNLDMLEYIDFIEYLGALKDSGMVDASIVDRCEYISINDKGREVLTEFRNDIRHSVRNRIDAYCSSNKKELLAERDVSSEITRDGSNEYTAHLYMSSNHRRVFSIDIQYASRNEAREAARIWQESADEIFSYIYDRLNSEE